MDKWVRIAQKRRGCILLEWLLSSIRQQVVWRNQEENSCFPSPSPPTPAVGVAVTSVLLALIAQGGRAGSEILWNKAEKIYRMPAGQGVPKRPNGSLCSDYTGKNFPWWLAVKSRIWLLMSSRVTHVINGTASWNLLESCKLLSPFPSLFLSITFPPSLHPSISHIHSPSFQGGCGQVQRRQFYLVSAEVEGQFLLW